MGSQTAVLTLLILCLATGPPPHGREPSIVHSGRTTMAAASTHDADSPANARTSVSTKAFLRACRVLTHPRCANCHPQGDCPLQGDDSHPHIMHIVRGPEGLGLNGLCCAACHEERNLPGAHMPPGSPGWQLPPKDMTIVFQGTSPHNICMHLKDPARNGMRRPDEVLEHIETAPIILWGWNPGEGRTPVPTPHGEFVKDFREWLDNGAACPE